MEFRLSRVAPLLFASGACALVYQVAWFRELRLIFGASTASSAAVLAVFMGGLGVGGAILGKRADRAANPLRMYAHLELLVAVTVAVSPLLVALARAAYLGLGGSGALGMTVATVVRLLLTMLVLGPSTILMGGTLPAAARAVGTRGDPGRQRVAALYGINTLGAVLGALTANFLLLEVLGTRSTLWLACLVNILVGVVARTLARGGREVPEAAEADVAHVESPRASERESTRAPNSGLAWFPPAAAAVAGLAFMLMELVWYRMLAPILGGSSYTFGLILAVALVGIAIGGVLYALGQRPATLRGFAVTCGLEALFIAIPYALGDRLAMLALLLRPLSSTGFGATIAVWTVIASIVVLPAAIVSGAQFPLIIGLYGRSDKSLGKDVGQAYLANTLGAIAGALAGGFGLVPALGALGCWKLVVVLLVGAAMVSLVAGRTWLAGGGARTLGIAGGTALALVLIQSEGPTAVWRHGGIGAGRADQAASATTERDMDSFQRSRRDFAWEQDGVESSVALVQMDGTVFIVNGKVDGHARGDASTQVMGGLLGALVHPGAHRSLVIGLGTGSTAGWLGAIGSMERVDVVELEPAILRVARDCAAVNQNVLSNPKVKVALGDAREALLTTREQYDIIFSEPSNPYRSGISSLYTREFYLAASKRLEKDGVFLQWIQAYDVDAWAVATSILTLHDVFPSVSSWATQRGDVLLIAQASPRALDIERMRARLAEEPFSSAVRAVWGTEAVEGVLAHHIANEQLSAALQKFEFGVVNTDDRNLLEFAFARGVGRRGDVETELVALASRLGIDRPTVAGVVDWDRVDEERALLEAFNGQVGRPAVAENRRTRPLRQILAAYKAGDLAKAHAQLGGLGRKPRSPLEALIFAQGAIAANDPEASGLIDGIGRAADREVLRARWFAVHLDASAAVSSLERAFIEMRADPWANQALTVEALEMTSELARLDVASARRLFDVLVEPFAVENQRMPRLRQRVRLARLGHDFARCVQALEPLEPYFPWDRFLLETRLGCYVKTNDPRAVNAEAEFAHFLESGGRTLDTLAPSTAPAPPPRPLFAREAPPVGPSRDVEADAASDAPTDAPRAADAAR